jgi:hypothetical protein
MPASIPASKLKLRRQEPTEHAIQDAILRYLAVDKRIAWAQRINSGAHTAESVNAKGKPVRRFVRYGFPGCSDILGQLTDGRLLAIEPRTTVADCLRRAPLTAGDRERYAEGLRRAGLPEA